MTQYTKRQRLETILAGGTPDRPPVALWRHWPGDDQDADALAYAHVKWQRDYDWDFIKVSPSSSFAIRDWGVEDRWSGAAEGTREYTRRVIHQPEDWTRLQPLDPRQGALGLSLTAARQVKEALGAETPVLATVFSPLAQARNLAGEERLLAHLRAAPEAVRQGLAVITTTTLRLIEAIVASGVDGIFYAVQHARTSRLSPAEYAAFGRPDDQLLLSAAQPLWLNLLHVHGEDAFLDGLEDYPVQLVNWHDRESTISLTAGLARVAGSACGGVSRWSLHADNPAQTVAEARDAWQQSAGRRWVLGAGCVIMVTTPTRNIRALRELVGT